MLSSYQHKQWYACSDNEKPLLLIVPFLVRVADLVIREFLFFSLLQEIIGNRSISGSSEFFM